MSLLLQIRPRTMSSRLPFPKKDRIKLLQWCDRHCCMCEKQCTTDIEIHHFDRTRNDLDNAIPLCLNCHHEIEKYNIDHPIGTKYNIDEIKAKRDLIYEKYTQHLVPKIDCQITQFIRGNPAIRRQLPDIGFNLANLSQHLPLKAKVEAKVICEGDDLGLLKYDLYSGEELWEINPLDITYGHFQIPEKCVNASKDLKIEVRVTIIDQYEREHQQKPLCWTYKWKSSEWVFEPRSFSRWK